MKRSLILILLISLVLTVSTNAAVKKGDTEFDFSASYINQNYNDNGSTDTTALSISLGHFLTDELQLGIGASGLWSDDLDSYGIGVNAKYHFNTEGQIVPYVGGQLNYAHASNSDSADGMIWGPVVGVKCFVTGSDNVFVFAEYQYEVYTGDLNDRYDNTNAILAGLGFKF